MTFETAYPRLPFAPLVQLAVALGAWLGPRPKPGGGAGLVARPA